MKTLILHYYMSTVDGIMTTMIDTYFNMKSYGKNVEINFICPELYYMDYKDFYNFEKHAFHEYTSKTGTDSIHIKRSKKKIEKILLKTKVNQITTSVPFLKYNRNFGDINLVNSIKTNQNIFEADVIICSARLLREITKGLKIELKCGKIIVIDTFDCFKHSMQLDVGIHTNNCIFLCNPSNFKCTNHKVVEYYHKYNSKRLISLMQTRKINNSLIYRRSDKEKMKVGNTYFENQGKSIFEYLYFGKRVEYHTDGLKIKDGLCYYLELFGIDGTKNHIPLKITREEIEDKLFMKENDYLLC